MKKLLRTALLCALAMFSTAAMADTTTVGNEDNSSLFFGAFSDYYSIEPNKTLTLKFKNYSNKSNNWNNWLVAVTTDAERGSENYSEYVVLRADNYGWQGALNTGADSSHDWYTSLSSNYNWDLFLNEMDGSDVVMTIKRLNEVVTIHADITGSSDTQYFEDFVINCGDGSQTIRAFLSVDGSHLVIDNDATKIADTEVPAPVDAETTIVGNEDNSSPFFGAFSDYYTIEPNKTLTLKFKNYSNKSNNYNNWIAAVTTDADRGGGNYSEYVVLRADNYGWQGALNTGADSSHDWYTSLSSNYNWDLFRNEMDGSDVVMTIKRLNEVVTIHADITGSSGAQYFEDFVINCGDGSQTIRAFLSVDGSHLVIDNTATQITDTEIPAAVTIEGTAIGSTDMTTGWWSAFSDYYTLGKNKVLTLEFTNYTNKVNNWNNWLLVVTTDADRPAAPAARRAGAEYAEYFVLRADNYCWGKYGNSDPNSAEYYAGYVLTNNYNWDTFKDDMYGAKVKLTVTRDGAKIVAHAVITTAGGTEYFERLEVDGCDDGEQTVRAFLSTDGGCLDLTSSEITDNPAPTGIETVRTQQSADGIRYNLAGQKVAKGYKGLVIENGVKHVVK